MLSGGVASRLVPSDAQDVHESVVFDLGEDGRWTVTQRHGVAEVVAGDPLPGTPAPIATVTTDGATWRQLSLQVITPLEAVAADRMAFDGGLAFARFMDRFDRRLLADPVVKP
jgi:hypothetical protein